MKKYPIIIVGAGFVGSVLAERIASQCNLKVLLIDKRSHIGGNAFDCRNEYGHLVHQYGPHLFHTNSEKIYNYLSNFTNWLPYEHRVLGEIDGRLVPIPFNLTSLKILFSEKKCAALTSQLINKYGYGTKVPILKLLQSEENEICEIAEYIYKKVFLGYTIKQWGCAPENLSPSVTARVPINISFDDRYFQDIFQCMPEYGYTKMFEKILSNRNIELVLNTNFAQIKDSINYDYLIYTGPIDEFFNYELGELPYRSLKFKFQTYSQEFHQTVGQVNYPNSNKFTRITEMKHFTKDISKNTTVSIEYPCLYERGKTVPYYPVPKDDNLKLYNRYLAIARKEFKNVIFAGRLGDYQYYNMDQATARALSVFEDLSKLLIS